MALYRTKPQLPFNTVDNRLYDIADFPQQLVPHTVGLLLKRTVINSFESPNDINGNDAVARAIMSIYLSSAVNKTAEAVDRLYRLTDTINNGVSWSIIDGRASTVPTVPLPSNYEGSVRGLLLRILEAQEASGGALDDEMLAELKLIVGALA